MALLWNIAAVGAGGAAGAISRYLAQWATSRIVDPCVATFAVNISGCLAIGVAWALIRHHHPAQVWPLLVMTGFLGGYTTFSSFSLDAVKLLEQGLPLKALTYLGGSVILGVFACMAAISLTDRLIR
ncbi:MAG: fluoride efflux transporter CrcB [Muribaculaceae bacterium]|nr:fluoride efflux transporter CrcB [Muribaculaceae bacterium]